MPRKSFVGIFAASMAHSFRLPSETEIANYSSNGFKGNRGCKAASCRPGRCLEPHPYFRIAKSYEWSAEMVRQADVIVVELKRCPRCEESLPLSEFGVCRARKDGLNLYCKRCIRQKIALSRQALREYKSARSKHGPTAVSSRSRVTIEAKLGFSPRRIARMLRKLSPADRVREAIRCGARTQKEIAQTTKLPKDEVCDALANLLLWTREIRTEVINHTRMYFVNETAEELSKAQESAHAKRKRGLNP